MKFEWYEHSQKAFEEFRKFLISPPLLCQPDFKKPFILTTDASMVALGGVLFQGLPGKYKPIAYARKTLNPAERLYSTMEREFLAFIWAP